MFLLKKSNQLAACQLVTPMRFELMALGLGILRSILLSYGVAARGHSKSCVLRKPPARGEQTSGAALRSAEAIERVVTTWFAETLCR